MARYRRPNMGCIRTLQAHSMRGWAYREGLGWVFDTLTPDEQAVFQSDDRLAPHTDPVCFPHGSVFRVLSSLDLHQPPPPKNWFVYCTLTHATESSLARFRIQKVEERRSDPLRGYSLEPGSYEAWLWADEIATCRELGCEITEHEGWGWDEWRPPATMPPRAWYTELTFIYALADPLTQEVRYVGKSVNPQRRLLAHLQETGDSAKVQWIRGLDELGYKPALLILEEVTGRVAPKREYNWTVYYYDRGHRLTNDLCGWWREFPEKPESSSHGHRQRAREQVKEDKE